MYNSQEFVAATKRKFLSSEEERFVPSKGWAEMIRKVYEVYPLLCPSYGGQMSIIAFIEDHKVIDKFIDHLKLTFTAEQLSPPQRVW